MIYHVFKCVVNTLMCDLFQPTINQNLWNKKMTMKKRSKSEKCPLNEMVIVETEKFN